MLERLGNVLHWAALVCALCLSGCASSAPPSYSAPPADSAASWSNQGGGAAPDPKLQLAIAQCRAEALQAAARHSAMEWARRSYAQAGVPQVDFSPIGRLGDEYQRGRARAQQEEMRNQILVATMEACMARAGYFRRQ